jgi:hypothetical protein
MVILLFEYAMHVRQQEKVHAVVVHWTIGVGERAWAPIPMANDTAEADRASPRVCQNLLSKSCVLPISKKLCKVKKNSSPAVWHNSLGKSRSNLHQES